MVFTAIWILMLALAVPLWLARWVFVSRLSGRERAMFRRLVAHHYESPFRFAARVFGYLSALALAVLALVVGLAFLKTGSFRIAAYSDLVRGRLYSGNASIDHMIDSAHYNQLLPVAFLTKAALLAIGFTLIVTAARDITLANRLRNKVAGLAARKRSQNVT